MPPFLGGGEMIQDVYLDQSTWADLPHKFEAGTPAIGEAIGMGAALDYLQALGLERIQRLGAAAHRQLFDRLQAIEGVRILGPTPAPAARPRRLAAFTVEGPRQRHRRPAGFGWHLHPLRPPLHPAAAPPLRHCRLGRASLSFTTTPEEIDRFAEELEGTIAFCASTAELPLQSPLDPQVRLQHRQGLARCRPCQGQRQRQPTAAASADRGAIGGLVAAAEVLDHLSCWGALKWGQPCRIRAQ